MKFKIYLPLVAALGISAFQVQAIQLDFANLVNTQVHFDGADAFTFTPVLGDTLRITGSTGVGDSIGDNGRITGIFHIGAVSSPAAGIFEALVTGTGTMIIDDGSGGTLSGSLMWDVAETAGTGGTLNFNGVVNLTGLTYTGSQQDLIDLATQGGGSAKESVTFHVLRGSGSLTLGDLMAHPFDSSFAGTLTTIPVRTPDGASSLTLLGLGMLAVEGVRRKLLKFQSS